MKIVFYIFPLLALSFISCKNDQAVKESNLENNSLENRFFTLDLTSDKMDLNEFEKHFFTTFPHNDPTQGEVVYDKANWMNQNMIEIKENDGLIAYLRFRDDSTGFDSHRLTSKSYYNLDEETKKILFVFKGSLPSSNGLWPAWWLNGSWEKSWTYHDSSPVLIDEQLNRYSGIGPAHATSSSVNNTDWPSAGEIDIIENINGTSEIHNTLHTCPQMCDSEWNGDGVKVNCANTRPGDINPGCSGRTYQVDKPEGTFACLWEKTSIKFYYWPPGSNEQENGGPLSGNPNPDSWNGEPLKNTVKLMETDAKCQAMHQEWQCENCKDREKCELKNMKMIFNMTICGLWAGNNFDSTGNSLGNCKEYVLGEGIKELDGQFMKIEYVSVQKL